VIGSKKVVVVLPAYNAEATLYLTYSEIPKDIVDEVILVDDASSDNTKLVAERLGIQVFQHPKNLGYGGNQKTCYRLALESNADIVVMVHPDYQYTPRLITAMASMLAYGVYDVALGSRILGNTALSGGMPLYKYISNRFLTLVQNLLMRQKISEYHTGYRAFTRNVLETLPLNENSDDFAFDNQMLAQVCYFGFSIGEVSCPTRYFPEASSINFSRSVKYGLSCLLNSCLFALAKANLYHPKFLPLLPQARPRLSLSEPH
jgi:glycosyltransferase involved in cell wall biosynthesis